MKKFLSFSFLLSQIAFSQSALLPEFEEDCLLKTSPAPNEACLFFKNPAFSAKIQSGKRGVMSQNPPYYWNSASEASSYQKNRVVLKDLDTSGYLQNAYFSVQTGSRSIPRVRARDDGSWRYPYSLCVSSFCSEDPLRKYDQVNTYYWANELRYFFLQRSGVFYANKFWGPGRVTLNASLPIAGVSQYIPALRTANLALKSYANGSLRWKEDDALLAEQIHHEYGHANFHAATGMISNYYPRTTLLTDYGCKSPLGCILGINEGVAFLHSALPFNKAQVFETRSTSGEGQYNIALKLNANKSAADWFNQSRPQGEAHSMGLLYASIWWNVRSNRCNNFELEASPELREQKIDRLFSEHLPWLSISDTIPSAIEKTSMLAMKLKTFGEAYKRAFDSEVARRYSPTPEICK